MPLYVHNGDPELAARAERSGTARPGRQARQHSRDGTRLHLYESLFRRFFDTSKTALIRMLGDLYYAQADAIACGKGPIASGGKVGEDSRRPAVYAPRV